MAIAADVRPATPMPRAPRIYVLAGVNGSGKSSIAGAAFREMGGDYYNPDEVARQLREARPGLSQADANAAAWQRGFEYLNEAIERQFDFAFETTLGASSIPRALARAADAGVESHVWYAGLATPELHLTRVRARVQKDACYPSHDNRNTHLLFTIYIPPPTANRNVPNKPWKHPNV